MTLDWRPIDENTPRDGTMVMLWYREFLGEKDHVTAGFWDELLREDERTWRHAVGFGGRDGQACDLPDQACLGSDVARRQRADRPHLG